MRNPLVLPDNHTFRPLKTASASRVDTYRSCPRKWWWETIAGLRRKESKALEKGNAFHEACEYRLLHGTVPDSSYKPKYAKYWDEMVQLVEKWEHRLPVDPVDPNEVEQWLRFTMDTEEGSVPFVGKIDWLVPEHQLIRDHKTVGSKQWLKTPKQIEDDTQFISYGYYAVEFLDWDEFSFELLYYPTQSIAEKHGLERGITRTPREIVASWQSKVVPAVEGMIRDAKKRDPTEVDADWQGPACKKYGGCDFRVQCEVLHKSTTNGRILGGLLQGAKSRSSEMGRFADLKKKMGTNGGAKTETSAPKKKLSAAELAAKASRQLAEKKSGKVSLKASAQSAGEQKTKEKLEIAEDAAYLVHKRGTGNKAKYTVLFEDIPLPEDMANAEDKADYFWGMRVDGKKLGFSHKKVVWQVIHQDAEMGEEVDLDDCPSHVSTAVLGYFSEPDKWGPTATKAEVNPPQSDAPEPDTSDTQKKTKATKPKKATEVPQTEAGEQKILAVNVAVTRGEFALFDDLLPDLIAAAEEEQECRISDMQYGKGRRLVAYHLSQRVDSLPQYLAVRSGDEYSQACLPVLRRAYAIVVEG